MHEIGCWNGKDSPGFRSTLQTVQVHLVDNTAAVNASRSMKMVITVLPAPTVGKLIELSRPCRQAVLDNGRTHTVQHFRILYHSFNSPCKNTRGPRKMHTCALQLKAPILPAPTQLSGCKAASCKAASCTAAGCKVAGCKLQGCRLRGCRRQVADCKAASPRAAERKCSTVEFRHARNFTSLARQPVQRVKPGIRSIFIPLNGTRIACRRGGFSPGERGGATPPDPLQPQLTVEAPGEVRFPPHAEGRRICSAVLRTKKHS